MGQCISSLRGRRFRRLAEYEEVLLLQQGAESKVFFAGERPKARSGRLILIDRREEIKGTVGFAQANVSAKAYFSCRIRSSAMAAKLIEEGIREVLEFDRQIAAIIRPMLKECVLRREDPLLLSEGIRKKLFYHGIELTEFEIGKVQYNEQTGS